MESVRFRRSYIECLELPEPHHTGVWLILAESYPWQMAGISLEP